MALCNPKTLRALHAVGKRLGYAHEDLSLMTDSGSLATTPESEVRDLLEKLRARLPDRNPVRAGLKPARIWRLYSSCTLAREIELYRSQINWHTPGGFTAWLKKHFRVESLEWIDSFKKAVSVKNALKRMANEEQKCTISS